MVFWKFQEGFFSLIQRISKLHKKNIAEKRKQQQQKTQDLNPKSPQNVRNEIRIENPNDIGPAGIVNEAQDQKVEVLFNDKVYEVDINKIKQIPADQQPHVYVEKNKRDFFEHAFQRYKQFVEEDMEYVGLFIHRNRVFGANEEVVKQGLKECLEYFTEVEDYENASEVKDLMEKMGV